MATGYDGSIRIDTKIDGKGFQKGLESMGSGLKKLAGLAAAAFGTAALVSFGKEAINAASDLSNAWIGLQSIVEGQGRSFSKAKSFIEGYIADGLVPLENAVTSYKNLAARGYDDSQIQQTMTALKDAAAFGRQASYSLGDAVMSATEGLKNENSILVDNAGVTKNVAKMWDDYAKSIGTTANNLTQAQKIQAEVSGILEETKFQTGDAAKVAGTYSGQVSLLAFNFQNLKVAVGNALIPIAQAVLPGINAIISSLTTLANVFAKVTALLFGKTAKLGAGRSSGLSSQVETQKEIASSGTAAADATDKLAAATGGAGSAAKKAAKDMKGVLAPFDELNILADNAADSLSGAAGGLGGAAGDLAIPEVEGGELFGDVNVNPELLADAYALIDKLNEMIPLIAGIGAGLAAWKIASGLLPELGLIQKLLGSFMVGAGITLLVDSIRDIIFGDGLTWQNILKGGAGGALAGGGIGLMLAKKLGLKWIHGMLGGAVIGLGVALLIESIADILTRGLSLGNGILGAIGGAIAGAAAGFLYLGGPGGAILGAAIGVGVSLVLESISDTIKGGLNLVNGAIGLIGGALAGAGVGFYLGGPGGAILGATIGIGLTFAIEGIASQIKSGANIPGAIMTIVGTALAGAGIGFAVGGGPIGAAVGATIGLVAGIVLEVTGIKAAGKAVYESTEDFRTMTRVIDECERASNRSSAAIKILGDNIDGLTTSMESVGAAQSLADEIYSINDNAHASAYELELMETKVEILNGMGLDGLHLTIDETTGRIVETKEATDQLIQSLQREAETAALQEILIQAYKDRYAAVADAEKAVQNVTVAEQALEETEKQLTNTPWWDLKNHAALTAQQEKQTEALNAATDARDKAVTAYDQLSDAIESYSSSLTDLSTPEANVGKTLESRMDSVRKTVDGVAADMPGYGENIGEGLTNGISDSIKEEETKSIFGRIGDWFKSLFDIHSPSKVFSEYGAFLIDGLRNGMDGKIPSVNELLSKFFQDTENSSSDSWEKVKEGTTEKWERIKNEISAKISGINNESATGFTNIKNTITEKIDKTMEELIGKDWKSIGSKIVDGVLTGLQSIFGKLSSWASSVWDNLTGAFSSRNARASISESAASISKYSGSRIMDTLPYSTYTLPHLANGAVIPPNQQFAAILGDQRSGMNLEAPADLIRQLVAEGIQSAGGTGGEIVVNITTELDGRVVARNQVRHINDLTRAAGKPVLLI